jgi:hypothetical protein
MRWPLWPLLDAAAVPVAMSIVDVLVAMSMVMPEWSIDMVNMIAVFLLTARQSWMVVR